MVEDLPNEIEVYRDKKWFREDQLRIEDASQAEKMIDDLGFCLGLTDARKDLPSLYIGVCGRRDAHMPRNVQKDPEASRTWVLKDEIIARGNCYYAKLVKGHSMFLARRMIPIFNSIWGCHRRAELHILSADAQKVLSILRKNWEMATVDLRSACGFADKKYLTRAIDELQRRMKILPLEVVYVPKFTYIWTTAEARFPDEMKAKIEREKAIRELARCYLQMCGMTRLGELSRKFGFKRWEAGKGNHQLVDEGFAERLGTGIYRLVTM